MVLVLESFHYCNTAAVCANVLLPLNISLLLVYIPSSPMTSTGKFLRSTILHAKVTLATTILGDVGG